MIKKYQKLSVIDIAAICGVGRSTVSYWIAKKSLPATRHGNKDFVLIDDLIIFLRNQGHAIPQILFEQVGGVYHQPIKPFKSCWEYWADETHGKECQNCIIFSNGIQECFTVGSINKCKCDNECHQCRYFGEYYGLRVAFIHQIKKPAAVFKDLYIWSGNQAWAQLCGAEINRLIGAGIEEFIHPDSLKKVINYNRRRVQGDPTVPARSKVSLMNKDNQRIDVDISVTPLINPGKTWLGIVENNNRNLP